MPKPQALADVIKRDEVTIAGRMQEATLYAYIRRQCPELDDVRALRAVPEVLARRPDNARDVWVSACMHRPNGRKHAEAIEIVDTTIYFTWE